MHAATSLALLLGCACWSGCGGTSSGQGSGDGPPVVDDAAVPGPDLAAPAEADASEPPAAADASCPRSMVDRATLKVVVSHPYDAAQQPASGWELLDLSAAGAVAPTGASVQMGRATEGRMVFTPDGRIGLAAQEDGTIGELRLDDAGQATVIEARRKGDWSASSLVMDPSGARVWVLDAQWRESGGGVYGLAIGCDGALRDEGLYAAAKLPYAMALLAGGDRAVVYARDLLDSTAGDDVHLLRLSTPPERIGGASAFGDDEAIVSAIAVTPDEKFALIADNNAFSSAPNRIGVVAIDAAGVRAVQVLSPVADPVALAVSPFGNAALVVSGFGNAIRSLRYDPTSATAPFTLGGELTYVGKKPQLPGAAVVIGAGPLRGRVLIAENGGVRQVDFQPDGTIVDRGLTSLGAGTESVVGALGVQAW
jgi:hypothetical protein